MVIDFTLPAEREAYDPPEARGLARDGVRLLVSRQSIGQISHHAFRELPHLLLPGDLLVVNDTGTLPAQVRVGPGLAVHFSTPLPDGAWLVELRAIKDKISRPNGSGFPAQVIDLPGGAALTLEGKVTVRLWQARLSVAVVPYLLHYGIPIRYSYVSRDWPVSAYQTVFSRKPGRRGRVIAAGTTVVRALETAASVTGFVAPSAGWTSHVVTPETGVRTVDGLLTGLHEPRSSHLRMLAAFAGPELLSRCYEAAITAGYLWHEFGDVHLLLP